MKIEIQLDSNCREPHILIRTAEMTEEVSLLLKRLSAPPGKLAGFAGEVATLLEPEEIVRVFAENQKVYAETQTACLQLRMRLYEAEALLDERQFVRISHSEIVNLKRVLHMDLSLTGTICIRLDTQKTVYVSRRYVPKIKQLLGL